MTTLADVARIAGVSKATASRAIRGSGPVAPATLARILAVAEELGFVPNRVATALAGGRSGLIAAVVPELENEYFIDIIAGAQQVAAQNGHLLTTVVQHAENSSDELALQQLAGEVDGFVLMASQGSASIIKLVSQLKPTVLIDREIDGIASVVPDTREAYRSVLDEMVDAGHERIALVGGPSQSWHNEQRIEIFSTALRNRAEFVVLGPYPPTMQGGAGAVDDVLAAAVDAIVPYARSVGLGLALGLRRSGMNLSKITLSLDPRDAELVGLQPNWWVSVDQLQLGSVAASRLFDSIEIPTDFEPEAQRLPLVHVTRPDRPLRRGKARP